MCRGCFIKNVKRRLPKIVDQDIGRLLCGATCYPAGDCSEVDKQLIELAEKTDGTIEQCMAFANAQLELTMKKIDEECGLAEAPIANP